MDALFIKLNNLLARSIFFLLVCIYGCGGNSAIEDTAKSAARTKPNIIYLLVDDMGFGDLGCYGQETLLTPNIDRLAAEGMRFTQHYSGSTVCAPSRASLLTGKHTGHCSVRGNYEGQLLLNAETTIPKLLKTAGYRSSSIGKWGVGHPPTPEDPLRCGFDEYFGYINMWHAHNFYPEFLYRNGQKIQLEGNVTDWSFNYSANHPNGMPEGTGIAKEKKTYALSEIEMEAQSFIERNTHNPFFLYLAINMPHANNEAGYFLKDGMEVPVRLVDGTWVSDYGIYLDRDWPAPEKGFAQMIALIDRTVGNLVKKLDELNLSENTLFIFTSDNGPHEEGHHQVDFFNSNGQLRGKKRDLYEGGIRVPMIVKWPGKVQPGSTTDHLSAFWDILPTVTEITGVEIPAESDGISFLPTLLGQDDRQEKHEYLYWEFYEMGGRQAVRRNHWKYVKLNVRDSSTPVVSELYNLDDDIGESDNVADKYPEVVKEMESILAEAHDPLESMSLFQN